MENNKHNVLRLTLALLAGLLLAAPVVIAVSTAAGQSALVRIGTVPRLPRGAHDLGPAPATAEVSGALVLRPRDEPALKAFIAASRQQGLTAVRAVPLQGSVRRPLRARDERDREAQHAFARDGLRVQTGAAATGCSCASPGRPRASPRRSRPASTLPARDGGVVRATHLGAGAAERDRRLGGDGRGARRPRARAPAAVRRRSLAAGALPGRQGRDVPAPRGIAHAVPRRERRAKRRRRRADRRPDRLRLRRVRPVRDWATAARGCTSASSSRNRSSRSDIQPLRYLLLRRGGRRGHDRRG